MFQPPWKWHEKGRRRFCRAALVAFCLLPTAAVLVWAAAQHLPSTHAALERRLSQQLGVRVTAERITRPRPGVFRWHAVSLAEPETGDPLLQAPLVEATSNDEGWLLQMSRATVHSAHAHYIWPAVSMQMRHVDLPAVRLAVRELVLVGQPSEEQTFRDVRVTLTATALSTQLRSSFRATERSSNLSSGSVSPARLSVVRNRQLTPPSTEIELRTGDTPLPCSMMAVLQRGRHKSRPQGNFRGYVWATQTDGQWSGELAGEFTEFDASILLATSAGPEITGPARLSVERFRFGRGRIDELAGTISAGPGSIRRDLLDRATAAFRLVKITPDSKSVDVAYDEFAATFSLRGDGLTIRGACADAPAGTLMTSSGHPALFTQPQQPLALVALVDLFLPHSKPHGPLSANAQRLARVLPLPSVADPRLSTMPSDRTE